MIIEFDEVLSTLTSSEFFWHPSKTHFTQNMLVLPTDCTASSWPTGSSTSWRNGKKKNDPGLVLEPFQFCSLWLRECGCWPKLCMQHPVKWWVRKWEDGVPFYCGPVRTLYCPEAIQLKHEIIDYCDIF